MCFSFVDCEEQFIVNMNYVGWFGMSTQTPDMFLNLSCMNISLRTEAFSVNHHH